VGEWRIKSRGDEERRARNVDAKRNVKRTTRVRDCLGGCYMRIVRANVEASWDVIDAILALRRAVVTIAHSKLKQSHLGIIETCAAVPLPRK
jgi:hypothetical protein